MARKVIVFGAGGHAKVVIDALEKQANVPEILVFDDNPDLWGKQLIGYPVIGNLEALLNQVSDLDVEYVVVALGNIAHRLKVAGRLEDNGIQLGNVIHPTAAISRSVEVGYDTVLFANTAVNTDSKIGNHVIINTGATVDHDCNIADGVHIAPGVNICGGVTVGYGSFIGAGSVVIPGVKIGSHVVVGAGSTVLGDIKDRLTVAGSPAKEI
jgi:sugar O-acyltransferase (sialic acid O-acetyltransferase NeuD family)